MKILSVRLPKKSYNIYISDFDLKHAGTTIKKLLKEDRLFIITNHKISKLYQKKIEDAFSRMFDLIWISIPDGEQHKNLKTCEKILTQLSQKTANRNSTLMALGGGVIGDITGFIASCYMRGVDFIQMPTTLLAQVDSSVGGKTGVDLSTGKNLVGAFYQPRAVFILTKFLQTLPQREILCGLAEVIKYGIIKDPKLFDDLKKFNKQILNLDHKSLTNIIYKSCAIKSQIVKRDEKEKNIRAILNFGHTLGHAIEVLSGFKTIKHGEAVAIGMVFAARLSFELKISKQNLEPEITSLLRIYQLPTAIPYFKDSEIISAMLKDKKALKQIIKFILVQKIGMVRIVPTTTTPIKTCLKRTIKK